MFHKHHITPIHDGGADEPWNLALLTIDEHADAHFIRWILLRQWEDRLAWLALSKQVSVDDVRRLAMKEGLKDKYPNGRPPWNKGKKLHYVPTKAFKKGQNSGTQNAFYGKHHSEEYKLNKRETYKGRQFRTEEGNKKHSAKLKGRKQSPEHIKLRIKNTMKTKLAKGLIKNGYA